MAGSQRDERVARKARMFGKKHNSLGSMHHFFVLSVLHVHKFSLLNVPEVTDAGHVDSC